MEKGVIEGNEMDHAELAEYLVEIEETMSEWDEPIAWLFELEKIQSIIEQLMNDTFNETKPTDRSLLACLELKARKIREYIIRRNRMDN